MKKYKVTFTAYRAEFGDGFVSIAYNLFGGEKNNREVHELTWAEAKAYFPEYAARQKAPSACQLNIFHGRVPPGYNAYNKTIYVKDRA